MGAPKQLLKIGERTLLASVIDALATADVGGLLVVTRSDIAAATDFKTPHEADAASDDRPRRAAPVSIAINDDPQSEMIDSVRIGLQWWASRTAIREADGYLVCPGDHAGMLAADVDACIAAYRAGTRRIIVATHDGRRGHPIIFPAEFSDYVRSSACDRGLNALPRAHADRVVLVECHSPGVVRDIDTPDDYDAFKAGEAR